jgi:hypothetical protein
VASGLAASCKRLLPWLHSAQCQCVFVRSPLCCRSNIALPAGGVGIE